MNTLDGTLSEINAILDGYRQNMYSIEDLRQMRGDLSVLLVHLGAYAGEVYEDVNKAEYEAKKQEGLLFIELRKQHTAADAERLARIQSEVYYEAEAELKGTYKKLDNMFKALLKTLDSMAAKMRDMGNDIM
jgi:hypothetical protein